MDDSVGMGKGQIPLPDFTNRIDDLKTPEEQPKVKGSLRVEKPPEDEISQAEFFESETFIQYSASPQLPKLSKPFEKAKTAVQEFVNKQIFTEEKAEESLREIAKTMDETALTEVVSLDDTESATSSSQTHSPPQNTLELYENTSVVLQSMYESAVEIAEGMPAGAEKARYLDFLAKVNDALIEFQELLYTLMSADSKGARDRSQAQLEAALNKIEKQKEEREEMEEKQDKAEKKEKTMGGMSKTFGAFSVIMTSIIILLTAPLLLTTPPVGWMMLAILVISLVDNCQKLDGQTEGTAWTQAMEGFDSVTKDIAGIINDIPGVDLSGSQLEALEISIKFTMVVTLMCVMISSFPVAFVFTPNVFTEFLQNSGSITEAVRASGGSDTQAQNAELYTGLAITCVAMITGIAASFICPAGIAGAAGGIAEKTANLSKTAAQMAVKALQAAIKISDATAKTITNIFTTLFKALLDPQFWLSVSLLTLQGVNTDASVKYYTLMSDIQLIQAEVDEYNEGKDALIAVLKKAIQKLLESMEGLGKDISSISNLLQSNKQGLSEVMTNLYG